MFKLFKGMGQKPYRIVLNGHPALRRKAMPIAEITPEVRQMAERMIVTLKESEVAGVGLAAPQVGESLRLIVIDTRPTSKKEARQARSEGETMLNPRMPLALLNPEIISCSAEKEIANEGCLSLPGVNGEVKRPQRVTLRALDIDGKEIIAECGGLLSRCLQHEIDHLDGVLFIDRSTEAERSAAEPQMGALAQEEFALEQMEMAGK